MSAFLKVLFLAVVQGVTEFLPVSSSGHLVLIKHLLKLESPGVVLEVGLHAGTLISILVYYRKRILQLVREVVERQCAGRYYVAAVVVSSMPCLAAYLLFREKIEALFNAPMAVAVMLCLTGLVLLSLLRAGKHGRELSVSKGLWIGVVQAFALLPGISRSGVTIVMGRHLGLSPKTATEFSLLISIVPLVGAALVKAVSSASAEFGDVTVASLAAGILVSACVGYVSIVCLVKTLSSGKFWLFGVYCLAVGLVAMAVLG